MEPNIKHRVGPPREFTDAECKAFIEFVQLAGTVARGPIERLVPEAVALAMLYCDNNQIGSAGLKCPNSVYQKRIFKKAGVNSHTNYPFELGWVHIDKDHQRNGYAMKLASAVLDCANGKGVYATTPSVAMKRILGGLGFVETGNPYKSDDGQENLSLFVRSAPK